MVGCIPIKSGLLLLMAGVGLQIGLATAASNCTLDPVPSILAGDTVTFHLTCPSGTPPRTSWDFGDGSDRTDLESGSDRRHAYVDAGKYPLLVYLENETAPLFELLQVKPLVVPGRAGRSGTVAYDSATGRAYVVNADNHSISAVDVAQGKFFYELQVGRNPRTIALDSAGQLWVVCQDDATLYRVDAAQGKVLSKVSLPRASRPFGIVLDPQGKYLYVSLEAVGKLYRLERDQLDQVQSLPICPTPRALAITATGDKLYAARFISNQEYGEVVEVDAKSFTVTRTIHVDALVDKALDNGTNSRGVPNALAGIALSPDGRFLSVVGKKDNTFRGLFRDSSALTFESTVRTMVAKVDLQTGKEVPGSRADIDNRSMPSATSFNRDGTWQAVATQGSNHFALFDPAGKTAAVYDRDSTAGFQDGELAPQGIVFADADTLLLVHYFMSRQLGIYDLRNVGQSNSIKRKFLVGTVVKDSLSAQVLLGKQIFYNAQDRRMSRQSYTSCANCHMDGGSDNRVWDFTDRGEGLRRTTSLQGRGGTRQGPVHWTANFDEIQDFEHDMRGPFGGTGFLSDDQFNQGTHNKTLGDKKAGLSPELDALAAYVSSLVVVHPSPYRNSDGTLTTEAEAGRKIFFREEVGCAKCHLPSEYTDSHLPNFLLHDVGTLNPGSGQRLRDTLTGFDTPTLKGIWEFGPYLHDGSAPTLMDVITTANVKDSKTGKDRHGQTSQLSESEKQQLVAFLQQLDETPVEGSGIAPRQAPGKLGGNLMAGSVGAGPGVRLDLYSALQGQAPRVSIHDLHGQTVATLGLGDMHHASADHVYWFWKGTDDQGRVLSGGVIFFQVRTGSRVFHLKWVTAK